jgi:glucans biosynthesis protein
MESATILRGAGGAGIVSLRTGPARTAPPLVNFGPRRTFSFAVLQSEAERLAVEPFVRFVSPSADTLAQITYDQHQRLRFRPERTLFVGSVTRYPIQLFHLGKYAQEPVSISIVGDGDAREVIYANDLFEMPPTNFQPGQALRAFASWRRISKRIGFR